MTTTTDSDAPARPDDTDVSLGTDQGQAADADAAREPDQEAKGRRSAYLPVLPEGWHYQVDLIGPDGTRVEIRNLANTLIGEQAAASSPHEVTYKPSNDDARRLHTNDLAEATRSAVSGAKLLDRLHKGEQEVRKAREEALSVLGGAPAAPEASTAPADR